MTAAILILSLLLFFLWSLCVAAGRASSTEDVFIDD